MTDPTLGIEIELPWPTMLARVDQTAADILAGSRGFWALSESEQARVQIGFDTLDAEYKQRVTDVFGEDIASGNDGFAEFALRPQHEPEPLVATVTDLYTQDILRSDEQYPLQVTMGHVPMTSASWVVLMSMEISGGSTPERMTQIKTWSRKGEAGLLKRRPDELQLGATEGFEMRSLVLTAPEALERILHIAQSTGRLTQQQLAGSTEASDTLHDLRTHLVDGVAKQGVDATFQWANPQVDIQPWQSFAVALSDQDWRETIESGIRELV